MAVRRIRMSDDEILSKQCKKVEVIDDKIRQLLDDMVETLHTASDATGLAANQVGVLKRLVVVDMGDGLMKLVNPEIISIEGIRECVEGCLSFPGKVGKTMRPQKVIIRAQNENGKVLEIVGEDELAKCFCHEIDHLDGKVFLSEVIEFIDLNE